MKIQISIDADFGELKLMLGQSNLKLTQISQPLHQLTVKEIEVMIGNWTRLRDSRRARGLFSNSTPVKRRPKSVNQVGDL